MKYAPSTGHRIKADAAGTGTPITWVHSLLKQQGELPQEWELAQCLYGEHLLERYPDKPVALVESEKTAVICACLHPGCIWLATGGKGQLNDRVEVLAGRRVIAFPDVDGYDTWCRRPPNARTSASSSPTFWRRTPRQKTAQLTSTLPTY